MNKNVTKGLIIGAAIAGILLYVYYSKKEDELSSTYNAQLDALAQQNTIELDTQRSESEYVEPGGECTLIGDFKSVINMMIGYDYFMDELDVLTPDLQEKFKLLLANTTHFYNESSGINKMMLYDFVKTGTNIIDEELPPRPLKYMYTPGVLSLGDKGNDVVALQELINKLYVYKYPETETVINVNSTFDKQTADAVLKLFIGTSALIDNTKATISKEFITNFNLILENLKQVI